MFELLQIRSNSSISRSAGPPQEWTKARPTCPDALGEEFDAVTQCSDREPVGVEGVEATVVGTGVTGPIFEGGVEAIVFVAFTTLTFLGKLLSLPSLPLIALFHALVIPPLSFHPSADTNAEIYLARDPHSERTSTAPGPRHSRLNLGPAALEPEFENIGGREADHRMRMVGGSSGIEPIVIAAERHF